MKTITWIRIYSIEPNKAQITLFSSKTTVFEDGSEGETPCDLAVPG